MVSLVNHHNIPLIISIFLHILQMWKRFNDMPKNMQHLVADLSDRELVSSTPIVCPLSHPTFTRKKICSLLLSLKAKNNSPILEICVIKALFNV